ncbi:MAG: helix-turn-helix transcriptional regulator [Verrucomicrobiae bacterium]|nr:helix-turn-helix transcriptional regulator [Verrucomicrobiae bacterium]
MKKTSSIIKAGQTVGQNIRYLRNARQLTQMQFAEKIGIHFRYLQKIELDGANASFAILFQMRRVLDCSWNDLFKGTF